MADKRLADIAEKMAGIDIAMLATHTEGGLIASRPMSNNGDVKYDGDSYYFTTADSRMVADIERDPQVSLGFNGDDNFCVAVAGRAELIRDKASFKKHWTEDLDAWFEDGIDTENLVMIKVHAGRIKFWDGEDNGEVKMS